MASLSELREQFKAFLELRKKRIAICEACPHLTKEKPRTCTVCGCPIVGKTSVPQATCPLNKW